MTVIVHHHQKTKKYCGSSNPVDTGMSEDSIKDNMQMLQCTEIYFIDESEFNKYCCLIKRQYFSYFKSSTSKQ